MITRVTCQAAFDRVFGCIDNGEVIAIENNGKPYMLTPKHAIAEDPNGAAINITDRKGVQIIGLGNPVIQLTTIGTGITFRESSDCTIDGITIKGIGPLRGAENEHSCAHVQFFGTNTGITIKNCHFLDAANHGCAALWGERRTSQCRFVNNVFKNGGNYARKGLKYDGAALAVGGEDITVEGNYIENWLRGIEHENSLTTPSSSRTIIASNRLVGCSWQSVIITPDSGKPNLPVFGEIILRDNIIIGTQSRVGQMSNTGVYISGANGLIATGNRIRNIAGGCGMLFDAQHGDIRDCLVASNVISDCDATGVQFSPGALGKCFDNVVRGNVLRRIYGRGVYVDGSGNFIEGNSVIDCYWEAYFSATSDRVFGDAKNDWSGNRSNRCAKQPNV